jgi:hypothetical protein
MHNATSDCLDHFGCDDFDLTRVTSQYPKCCPIRNCLTDLIEIPYGKGTKMFCPSHGLRFHANTFVYWNGAEQLDMARLRNFRIRSDLAKNIALNSVGKAESYRLGYEMSEDALTWNVFVGLAEAGRLHLAVKFLTGREIKEEPELYLWGGLVDVKSESRRSYEPLGRIRSKLEQGISKFKTEPDVMLVLEGRLIVCIEAKFGSGNTLAHAGTVNKGEKPTDRTGLLRRYLEPASPHTKRAIDRDAIGPVFHSQLFRNVIFASEMADGVDWHVVNLVSATLWKKHGRETRNYSFRDPSSSVVPYLSNDYRHRFTFRTWERLYTAMIMADESLDPLESYIRTKSAHYLPAFDLD